MGGWMDDWMDGRFVKELLIAYLSWILCCFILFTEDTPKEDSVLFLLKMEMILHTLILY